MPTADPARSANRNDLAWLHPFLSHLSAHLAGVAMTYSQVSQSDPDLPRFTTHPTRTKRGPLGFRVPTIGRVGSTSLFFGSAVLSGVLLYLISSYLFGGSFGRPKPIATTEQSWHDRINSSDNISHVDVPPVARPGTAPHLYTPPTTAMPPLLTITSSV